MTIVQVCLMGIIKSSCRNARKRNGIEKTANPLRVRYSFQLDDKVILPAQETKLSKTANMFTAIMRQKVTFTGTMQTLLNHARTFENDYAVGSVEVRTMEMLEEMMFSNFLRASSRTTNARFIRGAKVMIKSKVVHSLPVKLIRESPAVNTLGTMHLDDPRPDIF